MPPGKYVKSLEPEAALGVLVGVGGVAGCSGAQGELQVVVEGERFSLPHYLVREKVVVGQKVHVMFTERGRIMGLYSAEG